MNGFIANFNIIDTICTKCCKDTTQKNVSVSNTSQTVALKCDYFLNVINCTATYCTVIIQNGFYSIIRNIYINYDMQICLPQKCENHLVTIGVNIVKA